MGVDVLILNTAVADFRGREFAFAESLVGKGGLAKCKTADMPQFRQDQYREWIAQGRVTAGGSGNTAPLMARAGLKAALGANLGRGEHGGLDAAGRYFHDVMAANGVEMSECYTHPKLPTGATFIYEPGDEERGGIAYFPNANDDFDFERFQGSVRRLAPRIVYYMYSGLSERGDANGGRDLAEFVGWCRGQGAITIVDSHTLTADPAQLIDAGERVWAYHLLEPLLSEVDLFFCSSDEAKMIVNTLGAPRRWPDYDEDANHRFCLDFLVGRFWQGANRSRMFGVTVSDGAYETHMNREGRIAGGTRTKSHFMVGEVVDLVGAGDSFRAGFLSYTARNRERFVEGRFDYREAIQMGNLFAALFIKAPLEERYGNITSYEKMYEVVRGDENYESFESLRAALRLA